jgi:single stranded DNA-binding protein
MSDLNRVTLSGRLVADPELKYLPSGTAVTNLRLASNRSFTSNGERRDEAVFVDVEVYGKAGEALTQHKAKGDFLLVDGRLRQHTWERDGQRHSRLTVVADRSASARTRRASSARRRRRRARTRTTYRSEGRARLDGAYQARHSAQLSTPTSSLTPDSSRIRPPRATAIPPGSPARVVAPVSATSPRGVLRHLRRSRCHACQLPAAAGATVASR